MKKLTLLIAFILIIQNAYNQVPKKILVEHFTNTLCGICSSRNPGLYSNLNKQEGVIHIAIHPSSPYANCLFNKHNKSENDARTNYYGVYGSTPRLVIQGTVISAGADYNSTSLFTNYLNQTTPAKIEIIQTNHSKDSIHVRIVLKTETMHTLGSLKLFIALVEDTVFYNSPNGETRHYDVFRKYLTDPAGLSVNLPNQVGDSVVLNFYSLNNSAWNFARIFTIAYLQDDNSKSIIQSESASAVLKNNSTGISKSIIDDSDIKVSQYQKGISIIQNNFTKNITATICDITGKEILKKQITNALENIELIDISKGIYIYTLQSEGTILKVGKVSIQ